jgi:hypothetical protein
MYESREKLQDGLKGNSLNGLEKEESGSGESSTSEFTRLRWCAGDLGRILVILVIQ